jgi:hypothetical protein
MDQHHVHVAAEALGHDLGHGDGAARDAEDQRAGLAVAGKVVGEELGGLGAVAEDHWAYRKQCAFPARRRAARIEAGRGILNGLEYDAVRDKVGLR